MDDTGFADKPPRFEAPKDSTIRRDEAGAGHYGAGRIDVHGKRYGHKGVDLTVGVGESVPVPIEGVVKDTRDAYQGDKRLHSIHIEGTGQWAGFEVKMLYVDHSGLKKGDELKAGDPLGAAQDVRVKHGDKMLPHVHYEVRKNGKLIDPTEYLRPPN